MLLEAKNKEEKSCITVKLMCLHLMWKLQLVTKENNEKYALNHDNCSV